jgi:PhzF family phenazine biosynthesis protein
MFKQVDAFTARPLLGNPVAVVLGADGLADDQMQRLATWTNLSETTFVLKPSSPGADYHLRIFHPTGELPFAGHPTIGSAHAILEAEVVTPRDGRMVMQCGAGDLPLRIEGSGPERRIYVEAPEAKIVHDYSTSLEGISTAVGAPIVDGSPPVSVANGPVWLFSQLKSPKTVESLAPDMSAVARLSRDFSLTGIAVFALTAAHPEVSTDRAPAADPAADAEESKQERPAIHIRCFAPAVGVPEDPVTGSANAALPAYLARYGLLDRTGREYVASQGTAIGRDGRVYVRVLNDAGRAEIGGRSVTVIDGEIRL